MRRQGALLLLACCLLGLTAASDYHCVAGISYAVYEFHFASSLGNETEDYYTKICQNPLVVTSTYAAAQLYCTPEEIIAGQNYLNESSCELYGFMEMVPYETVKANLTSEFIASLQVVGYDDIVNQAATIFNSSILVSKDLATIGIRTLSAWDKNYQSHKDLGWANYGFWGFVLLAGILNRLLQHIRGSHTPGLNGSSQKSPNGAVQKSTHWVRTNLIVPATLGTYRQRLFYWCTIPTRMETIIVVCFYILNIVISSPCYDVFFPNLYYTSQLQGWRYFSDRTGILSYSNLPLLWMFSGRNNIFIWATGWSFSRFNIFHRHIARVAVIEAIAHSVGYTVMSLIEGGKAELYANWKEQYWYMGGLATITMSLLLGASSIFLRMKSYEIFLLLHIVLSIVTIVGLCYHTWIFVDHSWDPYLWPVVAIWCFDRFLRLVRQAYVNLHVGTKGLKFTGGTASYDVAADLITLTVKPAGKWLRPENGQHYFIYQYNTWRGWENHPFSLASWTTGSSMASTASSTISSELVNKEIDEVRTSSISNSGDSIQSPIISDPGVQTLTFYVRPGSGFTGRLKKQCLAHTSGPLSVRLILEGPYGHHFNTTPYSNLVLVAGGSGIAGVLPFLRSPHMMPTQAQNQAQYHEPLQNITLLWSAKHTATITNIITSQAHTEFALCRRGVTLDLHVTRESQQKISSAEGVSTTDNTQTSTNNGGADQLIKEGRADIKNAVRENVLASSGRGGKTAVVVCGPPGMADEVRDAVHGLLKEGVSGLEFVEESFGW